MSSSCNGVETNLESPFLEFNGLHSQKISTTIELTNKEKTKKTFKIKLNNPKQYTAKPNHGELSPFESTKIVMTRLPSDSRPNGASVTNDKLLIEIASSTEDDPTAFVAKNLVLKIKLIEEQPQKQDAPSHLVGLESASIKSYSRANTDSIIPKPVNIFKESSPKSRRRSLAIPLGPSANKMAPRKNSSQKKNEMGHQDQSKGVINLVVPGDYSKPGSSKKISLDSSVDNSGSLEEQKSSSQTASNDTELNKILEKEETMEVSPCFRKEECSSPKNEKKEEGADSFSSESLKTMIRQIEKEIKDHQVKIIRLREAISVTELNLAKALQKKTISEEFMGQEYGCSKLTAGVIGFIFFILGLLLVR